MTTENLPFPVQIKLRDFGKAFLQRSGSAHLVHEVIVRKARYPHLACITLPPCTLRCGPHRGCVSSVQKKKSQNDFCLLSPDDRHSCTSLHSRFSFLFVWIHFVQIYLQTAAELKVSHIYRVLCVVSQTPEKKLAPVFSTTFCSFKQHKCFSVRLQGSMVWLIASKQTNK